MRRDFRAHNARFFYFPRNNLDRAELARTHGIKIKVLLQNTPGATEYKKHEKLYCLEAKKLPANSKLTTNLVIIPKKVVIHQLTPPAMAIVIENKSIIQLHRELFYMIWQSIKNNPSPL